MSAGSEASHSYIFFLSLQRKYFNQLLPSVFQSLQDMDEKRIKCIQNFLLKSIQSEREVLPIISQCLGGMEKAAMEINEKEVGHLESLSRG